MSVHLRLLADGRSKLCLIPALICEWNLMLRALLSAQAASNWVVSWSTRCVYLVRPDRPKFFTCSTRHTSNTAPFRVGHARNFRPKTTSPPITEARDSEWQWHQLGRMQVCTSQTDNHASTPPLSFLQAGCPSCRPTNSVKALKT